MAYGWLGLLFNNGFKGGFFGREFLIEAQVFDDESLAFRCVFAHIVFQQFLNAHLFGDEYRIEANVFTNEVGKLVGA